MTVQQQNLTDETMSALTQLLRAMDAKALPFWAHLDLTMGQAKAAVFLAHEHAMTVGRLACALGVGQPAASILVDRLVHSGLVQRTEDPDDRRRTIVQLSPQGREIVNQVQRYRLDVLHGWIAQLDDEALADFCRGARALASIAMADHPGNRKQHGTAGSCPDSNLRI